MWSFVAVVCLPLLVAAAYLWLVAADQYASSASFSVRKEESQSLEFLGGMSRMTGSATSDGDILYEYVQSLDLVGTLDNTLGLRGIFSLPDGKDPVFAFDPRGSIEDLERHWRRKVRITHDTGTGLLTLRVLAFRPEDAQAIATGVIEESSRMINALSVNAREDATRHAREELDRAVARLKAAREQTTSFRLTTQIVDPETDLQGHMGVINSLQAQLAEALVDLDLLRETTSRGGDPRIAQAERRIQVIGRRISEERKRFGEGAQGADGGDYARLVGTYEQLMVDQQFAEQTYASAMAAHDAALAEAQRQSRYLAIHIRPTVAERSMYPQRWLLIGQTAFFLLMGWAMAALVYYSLRDRR